MNYIKQGMLPVYLIVLSAIYFYLFADTHNKLIDIWTNSNTYGHGFLILPIVAWLIYQKRYQFQGIESKTSIIGSGLLLGASLLWSVSRLSGINVLEQLFAIMIPVTFVWAVWGWKTFYILKFPFFFLFFAIPVGDFLIPYLQFITADISIYMLKLLGIPVYRDGMFIQIPNGNFIVAEACSGIRFLISTFTIGVLFGYLNIQNVYRRSIFIILCLAVPILGNGLRAFLMILIGHLSDMKAAVGFDHLVYGWLFFSIILVILFIIGHFLSDVHLASESTKPKFIGNSTAPSKVTMCLSITLMVVGPIVYHLYSIQLEQQMAKTTTSSQYVGAKAQFEWQPNYPNADALLYKSIKREKFEADLFIANYEFEADNKELISSQNELFDKDIWSLDSISNGSVIANDGNVIPYKEFVIVNILGKERLLRLTHLIGDSFFAGNLNVKFNQLINKMLLNDLGGNAFIISIDNDISSREQLDLYMKNSMVAIDIKNMQRVH